MSDHSTKREHGFSLLEMVVAMALGTLVMGAAVQIYSQGVAATWKVSQRAEMQQDFRAATNMLTRDLSLAGAGLGNNVAIALPSATTPVYGCDQTSTCYINGLAAAYPLQAGTPYLYGLLPGYQIGPTLHTPPGATDAVTVIYTDNSFYLNCYTATVTAKGVVTFAPAASPAPWPPVGCLPNGVTTPQNVNDSVAGLSQGDLVLMSLNGTSIVGEVTGPVTASGTNTYTVPFANGDVLHMNQTSGANYLNSVGLNASGTGPTRLLVITYYIDNSISPPRLMRQVSGHTPMPVAENVVYLKFSYDLYNDATNLPVPNQVDGGASIPLLPNQITKINILHMAMDSTLKGGQGGYQGLDLVTSVSARDLTYNNAYPLSP
jgi:prepilin-type N-terminal cleavage/methylation domain-containing protein